MASNSGSNAKQQQQLVPQARSMFADGFHERHDLEQYFWSQNTVHRLMGALDLSLLLPSHSFTGHICCLATPSLAHAFYSEEHRVETLLDIDTRFQYLPGFRYFDLRKPTPCHDHGTHSVIVFDPPFFYIPLQTLFHAVVTVVGGNFKTKMMIGFLRREESSLLKVFAAFNLRRTKFVLEYATVKPNKWRNYALYSNVDLPGIKRI